MNITGTVLLNARGVNINGYDCFVNLSIPNKNTYNSLSGTNSATLNVPLSGYPSYSGISNSHIKFSPISLVFSNYYTGNLTYNNNLTSAPNSFTISSWQKGLVINESQAQSGSRINHYRSKSCASMCHSYFHYNSGRKSIEVLKSDGNWNTQTNSINFANDNWHHFAICKSGNRVQVFIDGNVAYNQTGTWSSQNMGSVMFNCTCQTLYIDDVVVIVDQALWSSSFTPPTDYLLGSTDTLDLNKVQRRNIIAANVDKKLIIPDPDGLKQY